MFPRRGIFTASYCGRALVEGLMDVRELAPALLALGDLFSEVNRVLNNDRVKVTTKVSANFQPGSFGIEVVIDQSLVEQAMDFFRRRELIDFNTLYGILFGTGSTYGVTRLIRKLRGRSLPKLEGEVEERTTSGTVAVGLGDSRINVDQRVYHIYSNQQCRTHLGRVVAPLKQEGIERVAFERGEQTEIITKGRASLSSGIRRKGSGDFARAHWCHDPFYCRSELQGGE